MNGTQTTTETRGTQPRATTCLVFQHGIANLTMRVDGSLAGIYRASSTARNPR
jgi:hypothetical protein